MNRLLPFQNVMLLRFVAVTQLFCDHTVHNEEELLDFNFPWVHFSGPEEHLQLVQAFYFTATEPV